MGNYFIDSSALIKRYVPEIGTAWLQDITDAQRGNWVSISRITRVEVFSAFGRRQREASLSASDFGEIAQAFHYHLATQYQVIELDDEIIQRAESLVVQYPLRAYDAVQLASAEYCHSVVTQTSPAADFIFLAADDRLLQVAQAVGLISENPNNFPP